MVYVVDMKEPILGQRMELIQLGIESRRVEIIFPVGVENMKLWYGMAVFGIPDKNLRERANGLRQTKVYWILHT